jgi:hypothetical protein
LRCGTGGEKSESQSNRREQKYFFHVFELRRGKTFQAQWKTIRPARAIASIPDSIRLRKTGTPPSNRASPCVEFAPISALQVIGSSWAVPTHDLR